ncbi:hypothetical protein VP01_1605g2 [Puccinia sorghi]|uniref:Uncharacterized protein n=1 Tax=Puccinia sorghi TaxID=27349 RepID=A0A0L6VHE4_9BASI|nr:hypothetical protein VP01_1605g2 [Puccinia sorghi]
MALSTRLSSIQAWYHGLFLVGLYCSHMAKATFAGIRPIYEEVEDSPHHATLPVARINDPYRVERPKGPERQREHAESDREKALESASDSNTSKLQGTDLPHRHQKVEEFIALEAETRHINLGAMLDLEDIFGKKLRNVRSKNTDPFQTPLEREYMLENLSMLGDMDGKIKNLCVEWIALIASKIKIDDNTPFRNIPDDTNNKTYDYLQHIWRHSKSNMVAEEDELRKMLGEYEATRRINALRHQLYRYTIARNWVMITNPHENKLLKKKYHADFRMNKRQQEIDDCILVKALRKKELSQTYKAALAMIFSETEAKRRVELDSYLANAIYEMNWWPLDFSKQCSINGLDCLSLMKVGDALQLGSNFLLESSSGVLSIDEAFAQVLTVMTDHSRPLPWTESPERAWLLAKYQDIYFERLKELSQLSPSELDAFKVWHRDITSSVQNDCPSINDILLAKLELKLVSWLVTGTVQVHEIPKNPNHKLNNRSQDLNSHSIAWGFGLRSSRFIFITSSRSISSLLQSFNSFRSSTRSCSSSAQKLFRSRSSKTSAQALSGDSHQLDKINTTILKTAIKAIPLLTQDNYTLWKNRVENMLDLQDLLEPLVSPTGVLSATEDVQLRTILTSKLKSTIHTNVITHDNEKSSKKIWKSISEYFASSQASNRARVFNAVLHIQFNSNDVQDFITQVKTAISCLHEVGIDLPKDIIAYLILHKLPPSMINISQQITHSDKEITADLVLDHLQLFANDQQNLANAGTSSKSAPVSLLTDDSKKCKKGWHNPQARNNMANYHSKSKQGVVRTSSGEDSLEIKGIGTVITCRYEGNLPCLNFHNSREQSFLSAAEKLHKSMGHYRGRKIPLDFFYPIGNPVTFLNEPKKPGMKIYPKGSKGLLIGYNDELLSYQILAEDGRIVETKSRTDNKSQACEV